VTSAVSTDAAAALLARRFAQRAAASEQYFTTEAESIARLCHRMAERFAAGGRLLALGSSPEARSDVRHVAVEFVHPVIVGKRALPAIGLTGATDALVSQVDLIARREDIVIAVDPGRSVGDALALARRRGCATIAFAPLGAEWELVPPDDDRFVRQELVEVTYHVLWELVHVFFEHRGLLSGRESRTVHDAGGSSFLYPFLGETERDLEAVIDDVRASILMKARESTELGERTLTGSGDALVAAAAALRRSFAAGGQLLAFGNGGSATDATDLVADLRAPLGGRPARPALDLTEDPAILTALANDIGPEVLFQRQVIAYGRAGDLAVAFSTSGGSANIIEALGEARRRGLVTVAFVGYDGGRIASERLADHVVVSPSQHIPRIQEAQATASHALVELVQLEGTAPR
jgi:D-sedoheptulose 7-phosphate isomerase